MISMTTIDFKRVTKKVVENIATKIRCNFCNKIIKGHIESDDKEYGVWYIYEGGEVSFNFGYGSSFDGDYPGHTHICDKCAEKFIFKRDKK